MAELGLSDISEMTTTSLSKPCGDDGERESDNSDLEDFENCDNALPQIDTENELSDTFKRYSVDIVNSEVVTLHNQSTLSTVKDSTFQTEYPPGHSLCHRSLDGDVFILDSHVIEPLNNQSNSLGIPETGHFGSHQTNSFTLNKKAEMEDRNSNFNSEHHVMAIIPPISQSLEESLDKHLLSGNFKLCDLKENTADSPCHSLSKKNDVGDLENVKDELDSLDKQMRIDVLYDNGNNHLTPEKHVYEPSSRKEGTLGRIDTMHEVEEIWASNPCMESSTPDVAILTNLSTGNYTRNSILEALRSNSELENFTECASQKESVKDGSISKCDEVMIDKTKIWDQILIMIFGKLDSENDTGSDSELSPLSCVADHLSRERYRR